jgi:hypothetical protein
MQKKLFWYDLIAIVLIIALLSFVKMEFVVSLAFFLFIPYLIWTKRTHFLRYYLAAILIGFLWGIVANQYYDYTDTWKLFGLTLFPFLVWPIGLFGVFLLWTHIDRSKKFWVQLFFFAVLFGILLMGVESLVYHVFHLRNVATALYAGIPLCNCIHAPLGMQIAYFLLGPAYFLLCTLIKNNFRIQRIVV